MRLETDFRLSRAPRFTGTDISCSNPHQERPELPGSGNPEIVALEDEMPAREMLEHILGEEYRIRFVKCGRALTQAALSGTVQSVLLGVRLAGENGIDIVRTIRAASDIPLILLSEVQRPDVICAGLDAGADDVVCKPVDPSVLRARIRRVLRRTETGQRPSFHSLQVGSVRVPAVDTETRTLIGETGTRVMLTEMELRLFNILRRATPEPVGRDTLSRLLTGQEWSPMNRALDVHVSHLRRKLRVACIEAPVIRVFRGIGYALQGGIGHPGLSGRQ